MEQAELGVLFLEDDKSFAAIFIRHDKVGKSVHRVRTKTIAPSILNYKLF